MYSKLQPILRTFCKSARASRRLQHPASLECLESRIAPAAVLSGIGTGLHKSSVEFLDSDGDIVAVSLTHGFFDITLDAQKTGHSDIDNLNIDSATAQSTLVVSVISRYLPSVNSSTPGVTNVNSITSSYTGSMMNVVLHSVDVQDVNLGSVDLHGGLTLDVAGALRSDLQHEHALKNSTTPYAAVAPGIDLNSVELASAGSITIRGGVGQAGDDFSTNDFDGAINVTGVLGQLVGANSVLHGSVQTGTLNGVSLASIEGSLNSTGDMTLDLKSLDAEVSVSVGGNLHLRLGFAGQSHETQSGLFGTIAVAGQVSGLGASTTVPIAIRGDFAGSLNATGDIASLSLLPGSGATTGQFSGTLGSEGNIGDLSAQGGFTGGSKGDSVEAGNFSSVSANGSIGNISSGATNSGTFSAGGTIGNISSVVTAHFTDAFEEATFVAQGSIGTITAKSFNGAGIHDTTVQSFEGDIGVTSATVTNLTGSPAISNVSYTASVGNIGVITATSAGDDGIDGIHIIANTVQDITGTAGETSFGDGIRGSTITANSTIGNVTGVAAGLNGANGIESTSIEVSGQFVAAPTLQGPIEEGSSIGTIQGLSFGTGSGIDGLTVQTPGSVDAILGDAPAEFALHGIANTTATVGDTIHQIEGSSGGAQAADGITGSSFTAGVIQQINADGFGQGASHGIENSTFTGRFSIGPVEASSNFGGAEAITGAQLNSAQVGMITVHSSSDVAHSITSSSIGNGAAGFNYAGVNSDRSIDLAFNTTGGNGTVGSIDVDGNFDSAALSGVAYLTHFNVTGSVHGLVGNGVAGSNVSQTIVVGDQVDSSVTFNYENYGGAPNGLIAGVAQTADYTSPTVNLVGSGD